MTEQQATEMRERLASYADSHVVGVYRVNGRWLVYRWTRGQKKPTIYREYVPVTHIIPLAP